MSYGQQTAINNMTAAAANLETEIIRALGTPHGSAARAALAELLQTAIASLLAKDNPEKRVGP